jgi:ABC-2 type transport system permease protein
MFAAVGAAVDNEADTQQLILPITMPLIVGLFLMLHTFQYPDSALSFWGSVIPFTSPMVMMARIAYGVPMWELALSIGVLVLTFVGMAYLSGRIYRVGILMYGKKPGWKEIWKWLKY